MTLILLGQAIGFRWGTSEDIRARAHADTVTNLRIDTLAARLRNIEMVQRTMQVQEYLSCRERKVVTPCEDILK